MSKRITESASVAVVCMYWMIHCIKRSLKKKIKNDISKEEKFKSETQIKIISQKIFEKSLSVQTDHRVGKISSNACIEWPTALNDHWIWKSKIKFEISQVEKFKSEYQKKSKSKNVRKNSLSVQTDHRVSISSSNACIEWPIALNDHWRWKSKIS